MRRCRGKKRRRRIMKMKKVGEGKIGEEEPEENEEKPQRKGSVRLRKTRKGS